MRPAPMTQTLRPSRRLLRYSAPVRITVLPRRRWTASEDAAHGVWCQTYIRDTVSCAGGDYIPSDALCRRCSALALRTPHLPIPSPCDGGRVSTHTGALG